MMNMRTYGLIGYPLSHSFSPGYFKDKFEREGITDAEYRSFPIASISELEKLLEDETPYGLNVTIPYKQEVIPFMDILSPEAAEIGAVNTIKIIDDTRSGHNTDIYGFRTSLEQLYGNHKPTDALILGTGGAAKAVQFVLDQLGINYQSVSRKSGFLNYKDLDKEIMENHYLIINTTPLGMSPNTDKCPNLPYEYLHEDHILYDLIYNPMETMFLSKGKEVGALIKNGLDMLHLQAERSWEIWNTDVLVS